MMDDSTLCPRCLAALIADRSSSIHTSLSSWQLADTVSDRLPPVTVKQNGAADDASSSASATCIIIDHIHLAKHLVNENFRLSI